MVSRPPQLRVGDEVLLGGGVHTAIALAGLEVVLSDVSGAEVRRGLAELFTAPGFRVLSQPRVPLPPRGLLEGLAEGRRRPGPNLAQHQPASRA
jgi:hypothetical protein